MQATANITFKGFGAKGFATGAARKALGKDDVTSYVVQVEGKWGFYVEADSGHVVQVGNAPTQAAAVEVAKATALQVPTLGKPSSNALSPFAALKAAAEARAAAASKEAEPEVEEKGDNADPEHDALDAVAHSVSPFGAMVAQCTATRPAQVTRTGEGASVRTCKVEKDRPEQNGIKRPSAGGMCRAVWDWCDSILAQKTTPPAAKDVRAQAEAVGWNMNNALIEFYQWRKYNGITGRAAATKTDAPAE